MTLALIVAVAANGVIGCKGALPWRLPEDLRRFRELTTGHAVIMGRRTFESLPRALPHRQNIVVTRNAGYRAADAQVVSSLVEALRAVAYPAPAFCIGGGELYRAALPIADIAYVTEIAQAFEGDATFPTLDAARWIETAREAHDGSLPFAFVTYRRRARG